MDEIPGEQGGIAQHGSCVFHRVDLTTVGQFTGLTDKNGKKIYEGDVVKASEKEDKDLVGAVEWKFECWIVSGANWADTLHMANYLHDLEVIGNIHDNPELLEG